MAAKLPPGEAERRELLRQRSYYERNKEKLRADARARYLENREKRMAYNRQYHVEHAGEIKAQRKRFYDANRERLVEASVKHWRANSEKINKRRREWHRTEAGTIDTLWRNAKSRAANKGMEFTIGRADIRIPEKCPVLGIPMMVGTRHIKDGSPSLDRIDNSRGYTPDNICVISYRANALKRDAALEEVRAVVRYMEHHSEPAYDWL